MKDWSKIKKLGCVVFTAVQLLVTVLLSVYFYQVGILLGILFNLLAIGIYVGLFFIIFLKKKKIGLIIIPIVVVGFFSYMIPYYLTDQCTMNRIDFLYSLIHTKKTSSGKEGEGWIALYTDKDGNISRKPSDSNKLTSIYYDKGTKATYSSNASFIMPMIDNLIMDVPEITNVHCSDGGLLTWTGPKTDVIYGYLIKTGSNDSGHYFYTRDLDTYDYEYQLTSSKQSYNISIETLVNERYYKKNIYEYGTVEINKQILTIIDERNEPKEILVNTDTYYQLKNYNGSQLLNGKFYTDISRKSLYNDTQVHMTSAVTLYAGANDYLLKNGYLQAVSPILSGTFVIPGETQWIVTQAFLNCNKITEVVVPANVYSIGDNVFSDCANLKKITFKGTVSKLGKGILKGCTKITEISFCGYPLGNYLDDLFDPKYGDYGYKKSESEINTLLPQSLKTVSFSRCEYFAKAFGNNSLYFSIKNL